VDQLGDYRLRKRLAVGGMGEVYLGEKVGPEGFVKPVVLKCVLPQLAKDRAFVQLFLDEARLAALLNHPNIAQVYDFGVTENVYYMAMEYVPGYTVDDLRRKHTSIDRFMPIEHIACVASQVCQGLHYAHTLADAKGVSLGLVHRDVSPHNLIVSVDGGVKIVDFGIAKARAGLTRVQAKGAVGKFGYMAPEQSRGESVDARTDVFSLGVCLWELVTNRRLHDAKLDRPPAYDPRRPVPTVGAYRRDVARQFERIIETALAIDKEERYSSCQEMHIDIERFLAAMTHYAGQAALAGYLRDLVEGKIEQPPKPTGHDMVEGVGPRSKPARPSIDPSSLEGAQRYEEVFGVGAERHSAPAPRAARPSWEPKKGVSAKTPAPAPPVEFKTGLTPPPALSEPEKAREKERRKRIERVERMSQGGGHSAMYIAAAVVFAAILIGAAVVFREPILGALGGLEKPPPRPVMTTKYHVQSVPTDAIVFIDGDARGRTPLDLDLPPGLDYYLEVRKEGFGTSRSILKATVVEGVKNLSFKLDPAGTLKITSEPPGAKIELNGIEVAGIVTPATLDDVPAGKVTVSVVRDGKPPKIRQVDVAEGQMKKLHFELDQ
jgi:serine/threonine protein kinase